MYKKISAEFKFHGHRPNFLGSQPRNMANQSFHKM